MDEVCRRAVTLPHARRFVCLTFDGGYKDLIDIGLSGAVEAWRALHDLSADRVSGRARRGLVARAGRDDRARKPHQPGDRSQGAAFRHPAARRRNIRLYEFLASWMRTLPPPDLSFAINDLCKRYSVDLAALSRERVDGLGRSGEACRRSDW